MKSYLKYLPSSLKEYRVSYEPELSILGNEVFLSIERANKLVNSHSIEGKWFRRAYETTKVNKLSESKKLLDYLQFGSNVLSIKIEEQRYIEGTLDTNLYKTRVDNITPVLNNELPQESIGNYSSLWHTDHMCPLDNIVMIIYLTDVSEDSCPLSIADPIILPSPNLDKDSTKIDKSFYSNNIPSRSITGPAGTVTCFSSHILHKGGFCSPNTFRKAIHFNIRGAADMYTSYPYIKRHIV